jgi:hypothetical protein
LVLVGREIQTVQILFSIILPLVVAVKGNGMGLVPTEVLEVVEVLKHIQMCLVLVPQAKVTMVAQVTTAQKEPVVVAALELLDKLNLVVLVPVTVAMVSLRR